MLVRVYGAVDRQPVWCAVVVAMDDASETVGELGQRAICRSMACARVVLMQTSAL